MKHENELMNQKYILAYKKWVVIFVHPIDDNFDDNLTFFSSYWSKTMKREKGRERIRISREYERENYPKVIVKKCIGNLFPPRSVIGWEVCMEIKY